MASQTIEIVSPSGLTLTASLFAKGTDTASVTNQALTERTNKKGFYTATITNTLAGWFDVVVRAGSVVIAVDQIRMANADGTYQVRSISGDAGIELGVAYDWLNQDGDTMEVTIS